MERRRIRARRRRGGDRGTERGRLGRVRRHDRDEPCADARRRYDVGGGPGELRPAQRRRRTAPFRERASRSHDAPAAGNPRETRERVQDAQRHAGNAVYIGRRARHRRAAAARPSARGAACARPASSSRPAVERPLQLPRRAVQRPERRVDRRPVGSSVSRGRRADRDRRRPRAATRRSTRTCRRRRPGRSGRPRRRRASARSPAMQRRRAGAAAAGGRAGSRARRIEVVRLAHAPRCSRIVGPFALPRSRRRR